MIAMAHKLLTSWSETFSHPMGLNREREEQSGDDIRSWSPTKFQTSQAACQREECTTKTACRWLDCWSPSGFSIIARKP